MTTDLVDTDRVGGQDLADLHGGQLEYDEQTVTVSAAGDEDAVVDDDSNADAHSVSSTGDYNGETAADVVVTIVEDRHADAVDCPAEA